MTPRTRSFYFDALRLSFTMARVAHRRLWRSLTDIEPQFESTGTYDAILASAFSDVWVLIDIIHRVREVSVQFPIVPKHSGPCVQVFLRGTKVVEEMRHHVQHLRVGIPKLPKVTHPLFGSIAWVSESDSKRCFSIWSGLPLEDLQTYSCTYDQVEQRFVQKLLLCAAGYSLDLEATAQRLFVFEAELRKLSPDLEKLLSAPLGFAYTVSIKRQMPN